MADQPATSPFDFWYTHPTSRCTQGNKLRFFARLHSFALACPRCGDVVHITRKNNPTRYMNRRKVRAWDPRRSRYSCLKCGLVLVLGVAAWVLANARADTAPPIDAFPTVREALALRQASAEYKAGLDAGARALLGPTGGPGNTSEARLERAMREILQGLKAKPKGAAAGWAAFGAALFGELDVVRGKAQGRRAKANTLHGPDDAVCPAPAARLTDQPDVWSTEVSQVKSEASRKTRKRARERREVVGTLAEHLRPTPGTVVTRPVKRS